MPLEFLRQFNLNPNKFAISFETSNNKEEYENILNMAHSTFDLSKFTVANDVKITENGIASHFANGKYVTISPFNLDNPSKIAYSIKLRYSSTPNTSGTTTQVPVILRWGSLRTNITPTTISSVGITGVSITGLSLKDGDEILLTHSVDVTNKIVKIEAYINGVYYLNEGAATLPDNLVEENQYFIIGAVGYASNYYWTGDIDLKYASIYVDDIPVFSGNNTGIDTIKPDDYTVVGNPTITDDGIASGFSTSNYIKIPYNSNWTNFKFVYPFSTGDVLPTVSGYLLRGGISFYMLRGGGTYEARINNTGDGSRYFDAPTGWTINTNYILEIEFQETDFIVKMTNSDTNRVIFNETIPYSGKTTEYNYIDLTLLENITVDLNNVKMYVDGNLVYQPCLKIPYTLTSSGSKIVDAAYRDRVQDMYEQEGYAPYYIIDESNETYSLPVTNQPSLNFNNNDITVNNKE